MNSFPLLPASIPSHPRLLARGEDWTRIKKQVVLDGASIRIFQSIKGKADKLLHLDPVERVMTGRRLLAVSREALERITTLAMVFHVTGDKRYSCRAILEMKAVANFADWNPSHFLDTAEMSLALAIGYDWLHECLDPLEQDSLIRSLLEKGIYPSLVDPEPWFIKGGNNWNQVCHAGMSAAAIVIADREPLLAERILRRAVDNLSFAAKTYAPDGAYPEGPMYWIYGTSFHVVLAASLQRFTASAQGVDNYEGFRESGDYITQMTRPSGSFFSYSDCRESRNLLVPLFWFAAHFQRPDWVAADLERVGHYMDLYDEIDDEDGCYRLLPLLLLWHDPSLEGGGKKKPHLHWFGGGNVPVVVHRSAFGDPNALYAAMKGGSPRASHGHMDIGSFIVESEGVSWALDLGMQEYESLESIGVKLWDGWKQEGERWSIFRLGPESHNILRFDEVRQSVEGQADFVQVEKSGDNPHSVLDLSPLYPEQVSLAQRGMMFIQGRAVLIQDEWLAREKNMEISWQFLTAAEVFVNGNEILLSQKSKRLNLRVLDSPGIRVEVREAADLMQSFDTSNPGVRRLTLRLQGLSGRSGKLRVLMVPGCNGEVPDPDFVPLSEWSSLPVGG